MKRIDQKLGNEKKEKAVEEEPSSRDFLDLANISFDSIAIINEDRFVYLNHAEAKLLGAESTGKSYSDIFFPEFA